MQRDKSIRSDAGPVNFSALAQNEMETETDLGVPNCAICWQCSASHWLHLSKQSADFADSSSKTPGSFGRKNFTSTIVELALIAKQ
ncbi:MAG: hypothetical protein M3O72_07720 [Verrucomicrobiota bacterium]|nr:hypothetical protein [Verrucomicrobiota bacterium]